MCTCMLHKLDNPGFVRYIKIFFYNLELIVEQESKQNTNASDEIKTSTCSSLIRDCRRIHKS